MNIYNELLNLIIFIFTGIIIGILFDIFRIIRRSFKTPDILTYIEDVIFWLLTGVILLFTIFKFNNGEIRIYLFIGLIIGLIIYLLTISRYFIKICVKILLVLKKVFYYPINLIVKYIIKPFSSIFSKITKTISNKFKKITKINKMPDIYDKNNG